MKISRIIARKVLHTITADATAQELVDALTTLRVGALVVSSDGKSIDGIVSERDVVRATGKLEHRSELHVRDLMTVEVLTCTAEARVADVMQMMAVEKIRHVPVVDADGRLISIVSIGDIIRHHLEEISDENIALKQYVGRGNWAE
jgi:CBS domain-containing protein